MNEDIAKHYLKNIITNNNYFSPIPIRNVDLLFDNFYVKVEYACNMFMAKYPTVTPYPIETYRSQRLQAQYYNAGVSRIFINGMHHYGIACDFMFKVDGYLMYKGDYNFLRKCFKDAELYILGTWDMGHVQLIPATDKKQNTLRKAVTFEIRQFQYVSGLKVDGIVGPKTIAKAKEVFQT